MLLSLGEDPATEFDGIGARLADEDRKSPKMAQAATVLLTHTERYDIGDDGLIRYVFFDVRRVSGTTDIEENAAAHAPMVSGRQSMRVLRRRIKSIAALCASRMRNARSSRTPDISSG